MRNYCHCKFNHTPENWSDDTLAIYERQRLFFIYSLPWHFSVLGTLFRMMIWSSYQYLTCIKCTFSPNNIHGGLGWKRKRSKENDIAHALPLQWRHYEHEDVSNHRRLDCLLNRLFRRRSKRTTKLRVTGLCEGNLPVTDGFPSQRASNAENVSIW